MNDLHFLPSDVFADAAARAYAKEAQRIREQLPHAEVRHTGGTSVRGVLTSGDVDLQVRVDRGSFSAAREALSALYEPLHREKWQDDSAYFVAVDSDPRVEVCLTVIGTLDDFHHGEAWRLIASDPELIAEYNALKRAHEGGSQASYDAAKRAFFHSKFSV